MTKRGEAANAAVRLPNGTVGNAVDMVEFVKRQLDLAKALKPRHITNCLLLNSAGKVLQRFAKDLFAHDHRFYGVDIDAI